LVKMSLTKVTDAIRVKFQKFAENWYTCAFWDKLHTECQF